MNCLVTVLYVDDQPRYRKSILQELQEYNIIPIGEASNGIECLSLLKKITPHVILLDLEMPVMDGNKTFDRIKELYPEMKIIILSQHDDTGVMENYISRDAHGFLPKRFIEINVNILADGIRAVNSGERFFYSYDPASAIKYTKKEIEAIPHLLESKTSKEIAVELGMEEKKVNKIRGQLLKKTNTRNATAFITYSIQKGLKYLGKK
jgi:two-component system, NarL family, response regulator DegU